jgi:hypothetical protein
MSQPPPIQRVDEWELRRIFNENNLWDKVKSGELTAVILESRDAPADAQQADGTLSQSISYRDNHGNEIARVHQYLKPDNSLGGSGQPDPKRVLHNGILYRLIKAKNRQPSEDANEAPVD